MLEVPLDQPLTSIRVFIDRSSTEFFLGAGEKTFTTHSYPTEEEAYCRISDGASVRLWAYRPSVTDDFVV